MLRGGSFPEFVVKEDLWRDGEAVWSLSRYSAKQGFVLRDGRVTIHILFPLFPMFPGHEGSGNVVLRVSEWRQFRELILAGVRNEWVLTQERIREEMTRKREEAELEAIRFEEDRREAEQRERETIAALLEGRPRQVEAVPAVVAEVVQEAMTTEPEDQPQDEPFPVGYRPRAIELEGD